MPSPKRCDRSVRIPLPLIQRAKNLRRKLTSHSGSDVPSLIEVLRMGLDLGLSALEQGGSHVQ